jgi:hypothetical protein
MYIVHTDLHYIRLIDWLIQMIDWLIDTANKGEHSSRLVVSHCSTNQDQKRQKLKRTKFSFPVEAIFKTNNCHMVGIVRNAVVSVTWKIRTRQTQDRQDSTEWTDLSYMIIASHLMACNKNWLNLFSIFIVSTKHYMFRLQRNEWFCNFLYGYNPRLLRWAYDTAT